jgi:hypothetical protein
MKTPFIKLSMHHSAKTALSIIPLSTMTLSITTLQIAAICIVTLSLVILNASQHDNITHCGNFYSYAEYRNTECTYAECRFVIKCKKLIMLRGVGSPERHYAQCHYAELRYAEHQ